MEDRKNDPPGQNQEYEIIVNGRPKVVTEKKISFTELVILAYGSISDDPKVCYTVAYKRGTSENSEGDLVKGKEVRVKTGMVFNVSKTDKS